MPEDGPEDPLAVLARWEEAGAVWRPVARTSGSVTIALCTCDGGEEVARLTTGAPEVLRLVAERPSGSDVAR